MKKIKRGNVYRSLPSARDKEVFDVLSLENGVKIERITSLGQVTPEGKWLIGKKDEWVILLQGGARLSFKRGATTLLMKPGDYVFIPRGFYHRIEWTTPQEKSLWLAVHF